jgi:hypothetical protein
MELDPYIESIHRQLEASAEAGGDEARAVVERLVGPLDAAIRLALQDALTAAADEITVELAPGSVEVRLRGGEPDFVVTPAAPDDGPEAAPAPPPPAPADADEAATARINLRLPEHLKAGVEQAAGRERLSVNAWLVRVVAAAVADGDRPRPRASRGAQSYTGWVR